MSRERSGAVGSLLDLLAACMERIARPQLLQHQGGVPFDYGQQIIEIVRHAAGQSADRLHLLRLPQMVFELLTLRFVCLQGDAHAAKGAR